MRNREKLPERVLYIIGSEGGFAPEEIEFLKSKKADIVTLGRRILRAETASIVVGGILNKLSFNKRVAFYTLGCKVNQYETESIKNQLLKKEYTETAFEEEADIYIVNSCTVTSVADRKTRNMLRRAKKINPEGIVIVTGCYAQTNSKELLEMEEIDYVIGNSDKNAIVNFIEDIENRTMEKVKNHNIF